MNEDFEVLDFDAGRMSQIGERWPGFKLCIFRERDAPEFDGHGAIWLVYKGDPTREQLIEQATLLLRSST